MNAQSPERLKPSRTGLVAALLISVALGFVPSNAAAAGKSLSPHSYKTLTTAQQLMEQGAYNDSLKKLGTLLDATGLSNYEEAVVQQMLGHVQLSRESFPAAIKAFERSLALQQLPQTTEQQLRYNLGQLYLTGEQPDKAITILEAWFDDEPAPSAQAHVLLAQAYAQKKQYRKAIPLLETANSLSDTPHAEWYEALLAMHYELQSYRDCVPLLKKMIRLFPRQTGYWQQLAGVHMALNNQDAALSALELAFRQDALNSEQEVIQLVQLYLSAGIPYKAARLLEQQMETGKISNTARHRELLAHAWTSARERKQAISALERAIQDDAKPELRLRLAQWYIEAEDWRAVTRMLAPLDEDINTHTTSQARLLLGIAQFELGNTNAARSAFQRAREFPKTSQTAQQWLDFIDTLPVEKT
jgi:tetratricopeptide (TPR) repeat protein